MGLELFSDAADNATNESLSPKNSFGPHTGAGGPGNTNVVAKFVKSESLANLKQIDEREEGEEEEAESSEFRSSNMSSAEAPE